jgi:hypothetical protein
MKYIMDNGLLVTQGISASVYNFTDSKGIERRLTATEISNLRLDILEYQNNLKNYSKSVKETINAAATKNEIKFAKVNKASGSPEVSGPAELG